MKIDWFDFWLFFSLVLFFFLFIGLTVRFFAWLKFRNDLSYIKQQKIKDIMAVTKDDEKTNDLSSGLLSFKKEIDILMKDVCFDLYDRKKSGSSIDLNNDFDFEESLEKILDSKMLDTIKEKDILLQQKDLVLHTIEEKNKSNVKEMVSKMFFLLLEKDKALKEKDNLIFNLRTKLKDIVLADFVSESFPLSNYQSNSINKEIYIKKDEPVSTHHTDFLNVNVIGKK